MAKELVEDFKQQLQEPMKNLERAQEAFDDLDGLMDGPEGFDLTQVRVAVGLASRPGAPVGLDSRECPLPALQAVWRQTGWQEIEDLRKKLENLQELRDLVRSLGRGGGKGPMRRAPEEIEASGGRPGLVRSQQARPMQEQEAPPLPSTTQPPLPAAPFACQQVPEETRGLTRSGELSRMMPSEMALLAHGYPRYASAGDIADDSASSSGSSMDQERVLVRQGSKAARRLHLVRRAERALLSYERTGASIWPETV